jgi:hypothetical protein
MVKAVTFRSVALFPRSGERSNLKNYKSFLSHILYDDAECRVSKDRKILGRILIILMLATLCKKEGYQ